VTGLAFQSGRCRGCGLIGLLDSLVAGSVFAFACMRRSQRLHVWDGQRSPVGHGLKGITTPLPVLLQLVSQGAGLFLRVVLRIPEASSSLFEPPMRACDVVDAMGYW